MRSALITITVLGSVIVGVSIHLQATAGAASATAAVKTELAPVYLMGAAHIPGFNDTQWRTSLEVCNFGGVSRSAELSFLHRDEANPVPAAVELTLASGQCVNHADAVVSIFGFDDAVGTIRLVADGDGVVAVARTYNDTPDGTYGTALGANPVEHAVSDGASTVLVHLAQSASDSDGFRTNLDLLNVTDLEIVVEIALFTSAGGHYGTLSTTLEPFEYSQETRVFRQLTGDEVTDGYAVVRTTTPGGAVMAAASLVDNRTGDTTTIESSAVPTTERWLDAVNLGTVINTSQSEWYPVLARDGSFMIFVSDRFGGYGSGDLFISRFVNGDWQAPQNLGPDVNSSGFESAPYLSADGGTLYFTSDGIGGGGNFDIWTCPLNNGVPGPRTRMPSPVSTAAIDCCPVLSSDGDTLYICSNRSGGFGSLDVWASHRVGGQWQPLVNLGETVNTAAIDSPRWISDDGNTLIIDSNRPGRIGGVDLWSVTRIGIDWLEPVNLGTPVNSRWDEQGPGFFGNDGVIGGRIYFGSSRSGGHGGQDIWCSDFSTPMVSGAALATGAGPFRMPPVSTVAREADDPATDPAPVGSRCCSSEAT